MKRQLMSMIAGSAAIVANTEPLTPPMVPPMLSGIELTQQQETQFAQTRAQIESILTPDQKNQLKAALERGEGMNSAASINLTPEQKAQLQTTWQSVRTQIANIKDTREDFLDKLSTKVMSENQTIALEDLNVSGTSKNRKLARAISDLGWRIFRTMLEAKAEMYGRDLRIINRWEPTSQVCSCCGEKGSKKELKIRKWTCLFCGTIHDRDINAATLTG